MTTTAQTQAILLLTAYFSRPIATDPKPLGVKEYGRFADWLWKHQLTPDQLLGGRLAELLAGWSDSAVTTDRLQSLLDRRAALAFAMEKWERAGLWVLTRSDADYPRRWKRRLRADSPAVLFGCGSVELLNRGGIAVIGSRDAQEQDLEFCRLLGRAAANRDACLVSGGARGVDETAMLAAAENDGCVVGILADSLLRASTSGKYRRHLLSGRLALVSPFQPEAGFSVGNAMARNKYIYCLADAAVVAVSGTRGGTWSGAVENLKHRWVPLWVNRTGSQETGNAEIVRRGARWLPDDVTAAEFDLSLLCTSAEGPREERPSGEFALAESGDYEVGKQSSATAAGETWKPEQPLESLETPSALNATDVPCAPDALPPPVSTAASATESGPLNFYDVFLQQAESHCHSVPQSANDLARALGLLPKQVQVWLDRAVDDKLMRKLSKPVRYQWHAPGVQQKTMFQK